MHNDNFIPCAPKFVKLDPEKCFVTAVQRCEGSLNTSATTQRCSVLTRSNPHNTYGLFEQRWYFVLS